MTDEQRTLWLLRFQHELRQACAVPEWSACRPGYIARVVSESMCARFATVGIRPERRPTQVSLFGTED